MKPALLQAYQVLQVAPWAGTDELVRAYRRKAKTWHPDLNPADPRRADMVLLNIARELVRSS